MKTILIVLGAIVMMVRPAFTQYATITQGPGQQYDCVDINNDGLLDIIYTADGGLIQSYINNGDLSFQEGPLILDTGYPWYALKETADFDGNGLYDLLGYTIGNQYNISIFLQTEPGIFSSAIEIPVESQYQELCNALDIDNDGMDEVVLLTQELNGETVCNPDMWEGQTGLRGIAAVNCSGVGELSMEWLYRPCGWATQYAPGAGVEGVFRNFVAADLNGDNINDLIAMIGAYDELGDGLAWIDGTDLGADELSDSETDAILHNVSNLYALSPVVSDVDGDGDLDIAEAQYMSCARLLTNDGTGNFSENEEYAAVSITYSPAIATTDVNHDGFKDYVFSGVYYLSDSEEYGTFAFFNDGSNNLIGNCQEGFMPAILSPAVLNDLRNVDFNNDGEDELVGFGYDEGLQQNAIKVLYQTGTPALITCNSFLDDNMNGLWDAGEPPFPLLPVTHSPSDMVYYSPLSGSLQFYASEGENTISAIYDSGLWTATTATSYTVQVTDGVADTDTINFGLVPIGSVNALEPTLTKVWSHCGGSSFFVISLLNTGNTTAQGTVELQLDDLYAYDHGNPDEDAINANTISWNYTNLAPMGSLEIGVWTLSPSSDNLGAAIEHSMTATIEDGFGNVLDTFTDDETYTLECSYDPNYIEVAPTGWTELGFVLNDTDLEYTVHFQNVGNAPATNVRIENALPSELDWQSFQPIAWSHDITEMHIDNTGRLFVHFDNIMLPDSTNDEPNSHGFVTYKIMMNENLPAFTEIENTAEIFFDLNNPVVTNTTVNTIYEEQEIQNAYFLNGASWGTEYGYYEGVGGLGYNQGAVRVVISANGEAQLGDHTYLKLFEEGIAFWGSQSQNQFGQWITTYSEEPYSPVEPFAYMRSEGKKIFAWSEDQNEEYVVYDFDLEVGDTLEYHFEDYDVSYLVVAIDTIQIAGEDRLAFYVDGVPELLNPYIFIEGIGHLGTAPFGDVIPNVSWGYQIFHCYTYGNENYEPAEWDENLMVPSDELCEFTVGIVESGNQGSLIVVHPNPITDFFTIQFSSFNAEDYFTVMDAMGRIVIREKITSNEMKVDAGSWASGVYSIQVGNSNQKIVRQ